MSDTYRSAWLMGPRRVEIRELPTPRPAAGEVLLRIDAATTCGTDLKVFRRGGHPRMLEVPGPFGHEVTGTVLAVGSGVSNWVEGDHVVVANSAPCGACATCGRGRENLCPGLVYLNGAYGEKLLLDRRFVQSSLYERPRGLDPELAALAEPLACVVHGLSVLQSLAGEGSALLFGAGPIGQLFLQGLRAHGWRVTVVDPNPARLEVAARAGAETCLLDRERPHDSLPTGTFHLVVEGTGAESGWRMALERVAAGGEVLLFGGLAPGARGELDTHRLHYEQLTVRGAYHYRPGDFAEALRLLAEGSVDGRALLQLETDLDGLPEALAAMERREILKAVIRP